MAEVFKARAVGPGGFQRDVVVKRILPVHGRDPEFIRMFLDEGRILGMLHHPNIVQAYDFGEDEGVLFLTLEFVEGPSLARILRTLRSGDRKIPAAIVAYIGRDICRALACVHGLRDEDGRSFGAIHRDVTPSNVILTPAGEVKLLDFGVATFKTALQITRAGTVKGKPAYQAPEQIEGKPVDGRVDLFAVGIVMHEMLTLQHLFVGDSVLGTVKRIMEMEIPSPATRRDDVPPPLERTVMRALARDRDQRFATAAEMASALDDFVVASKLHLDDVAAFVSETAGAAAPRPVLASPAVVRGPPVLRPSIVDDPPPTRKGAGNAAVMTRPRRRRRVVVSLPRAAVAVGFMLALLGVGSAFGLRATSGRNAPALIAATSSPISAPASKP
jgi:serine/threonine-protein kinase